MWKKGGMQKERMDIYDLAYMISGGIEKIICGIRTGHSYSVEKWHFTHGANGNEPAYIEGFFVCPDCGKHKYFTVERGSKFEQYIIENMKERQW